MTTTICHCFGHTDDEIRRDLAANGESTILAAILCAKRFGQCRCRERNPKGT